MPTLAPWSALAAAVLAFPVLAQAPGAVGPVQELAWPQSFEVQDLQTRWLVFAVTQPGPVTVTVQSQGAAVSFAIRGPLPNPQLPAAPQSGSGVLRWSYNVTPQDLQHGIFWQIELRLAQPAPVQAGGHANGMITLQRPPVDPAMVQQAAQALVAQRRKPTDQEHAQALMQVKARLNADFNARKAQRAQRRAQREAANRAQLQPLIDQMRRQNAAGPGAAPGAADSMRTRALPPFQRFPPGPPPPPSIGSLTIANNQDTINMAAGSYGQPGDLVTVTGTGFGSGGELHFIIGPLPTQDMIAAANVWLGNQIVAPVPMATGVLPYAGKVYVKRLSDGATSLPINFQFEPDMAFSEITLPADYIIAQPYGDWGARPDPDGSIEHFDMQFMNFAGVYGTDRFFINTRLQNGWRVSAPALAAVVSHPWNSGTGGSAFAISLGLGSDVLSTIVAFSSAFGDGMLSYTILIPIEGPIGLSPGVTCQIVPAGADPCPP